MACQNCGTKFHIDEVGEEFAGCMMEQVLKKAQNDEEIIIEKEYIESYKERFESWEGIV